MSFLNGLRGVLGGSSPGHTNWNEPDTVDDIRYVFSPNSGMHLLYKHSNSCGICFFSKKSVETVMKAHPDTLKYHFVEVRQNREISNFIQNQTGIKHESPQALLVHNGKVLWNASHGAITDSAVAEAIASVQGSST
ncbi:MAG: bacillithiol system redox-active protein YtxJ [Balneolaceae bacterium]|nr:MAG: bacillithiol system redox-active protein YtxJ [Balneolaceae bacterium]